VEPATYLNVTWLSENCYCEHPLNSLQYCEEAKKSSGASSKNRFNNRFRNSGFAGRSKVGEQTGEADGQSVPPRLAIMMFLQYVGLGAWIVPLTRYLPLSPAQGGLGFSPMEVGFVYMTLAVGALVAPFVVGLLADRWFAAEKVIGWSHVSMAVLLALAGWWCDKHRGVAADPAAAVWPLVAIMLVYSIGCQISLTLTNVVSFRNLRNSDDSFSYIRLVGTFGWVVGGVVVGWGLTPLSSQPLYFASFASLAMVAFSLVLPHTPPKGYGRPVAEVLGLPAIKMFRDRSVVVFAIVLFLGNMLNQFYILFAARYLNERGVRVDLGALGGWGPEVIMTLAQWCEIVCMALTPWLVKKLGIKKLMMIGVAGWLVRNALFYSDIVPGIVAIAIPMHGWSYAFFGMLGALFVDREAPAHLRAGTQSLVTFLASGPAVMAGYYAAARVVEARSYDGTTDWQAVWLIPFVGYIVAFVVFIVLFREPPEKNGFPDETSDTQSKQAVNEGSFSVEEVKV
jgi:nucleoside transporter